MKLLLKFVFFSAYASTACTTTSSASRETSLREPASSYQKMIFQEILPGKFLMGAAGHQIQTEITKPFSMMSTEVTQYMWSKIQVATGKVDQYDVNPSSDSLDDDSTDVEIKSLSQSIHIRMKPNNPVQEVSWDASKRFISVLNNFSNSNDEEIQTMLKDLIPGHIKGDLYDFPSEAQREFVMRNRGNSNKLYFDKDDSSELANYAWFKFSTESILTSHPVGLKSPRLINNSESLKVPFYDLEGNVWEWCKDSLKSVDQTALSGGKDPLSIKGDYRVIRGGAYSNPSGSLSAERRILFQHADKSQSIGLRLIKTQSLN